jgi:hypothetical protein
LTAFRAADYLLAFIRADFCSRLHGRDVMKLRFVIALVVALIGLSSYARADFVGQQVTVLYDFPSIDQINLNLGTQTISAAGNTFTSYQGIFTPKVSSSAVEFDFTEDTGTWNPQAAFNGPVIEEASNGPAISGVTLTAPSTSGLTSSDLTFDSHDIFLNFAGSSELAGSEVLIGVQFSGDPVASPLPSTAFAGFGLLAGAAAFAVFSHPARRAANRR